MALSDAIEKYVSGNLLIPFRQNNLWRGIVRDYSSEMRAEPGGHVLKLVTDRAAKFHAPGSSAAAGAYLPNDIKSTFTPDATLANSQWSTPVLPDVEEVELQLTEVRDLAVLINSLVDRRVRPNLVASRSQNASREFQEAINYHIRETVIGVAAAGQRSALTAGTAANFAKGIGDSANSAFRSALLDEFGNAAMDFTLARWPMEGRVAIVSPRIHKYLTDALQAEKLLLAEVNREFLAEGMTVKYKGFDIIQDQAAGDGTLPPLTPTGIALSMLCGVRALPLPKSSAASGSSKARFTGGLCSTACSAGGWPLPNRKKWR